MNNRGNYGQAYNNQMPNNMQQTPPPPNYGMQAMPPGQHQWAHQQGSTVMRSGMMHPGDQLGYSMHPNQQQGWSQGQQPPPPPGAPRPAPHQQQQPRVMRPQQIVNHPPGGFNMQQQQSHMWQQGQQQQRHMPSISLQAHHSQFLRPLMPPPHPAPHSTMHMNMNMGMHHGGGMMMQSPRPYHMVSQGPMNTIGGVAQGMNRDPYAGGQQKQKQQQQQQIPPGPRPLGPPPTKKQKKKDQVKPVEKLTQDPVVREPVNEGERKEVEAWKAERKKHWPTADNVQRKEKEAQARRERGELDLLREERRQRLKDVLARQQAMGLARKAGTEDLIMELNRRPHRGGRGGGGRGGGRQGGGRGGRGRGAHSFAYEAFQTAGDAVAVPNTQEQHRGIKRKAEGGGEGAIDPRASTPVVPSTSDFQPPIEEQEVGPDAKANVGGAPPEGLASLVAYDSDGGGSDSAATRAGPLPNASISPPEAEMQQPDVAIETSRGGHQGRGRGRSSTGHHQQQQQHPQHLGRGRGRGRRGGRHQGQDKSQQQQRQTWVRPRDPSLLEKLLAKEMRQDRSYLLQAFRFFINNNFLMDVSAGVPLKFPASAVQGIAAAPVAPRPASLAEILARVDKEGLDIEVSDDEGGQLQVGHPLIQVEPEHHQDDDGGDGVLSSSEESESEEDSESEEEDKHNSTEQAVDVEFS